MTYPHHPRFGSNCRGLTGRMDLLLECCSYIPFEARVRTAYAFMLETFRHVGAHAAEILAVVAASRTPPDRIAVRYRLDVLRGVDVLTRVPRTLDGTPRVVDVAVPTVIGSGAKGGRAILGADEFGDVRVAWPTARRDAPAGFGVVRADQPLGSIAVYLCEPESDDSALENGALDPVAVAEELPVWRGIG